MATNVDLVDFRSNRSLDCPVHCGPLGLGMDKNQGDTGISEVAYLLFAEWELAQERGESFSLESVEPLTLRGELAELIGRLGQFDKEPPGEPSPEVPRDTERYEFVEFIARGGMGEVWRGTDKVLQRSVALKVVRRQFGLSWSRFRNEALLVAQLSHPGIVAVHDFGVLMDGRPFFVMKLIAGKTLEEWLLDDGALPNQHQSELLLVFRQICQAVAYAHARRPTIIHRDLKPQNIMRGEFGDVYVMDWGIARSGGVQGCNAPELESDLYFGQSGDSDSSFATTPGIAKGTLSYMAPEQYRGEIDKISPATDVFGLGGILYRMLAGQPLFTARDRQRAEVADSSFMKIEGLQVNSGISEILKKCLCDEPAQRFQNATEVVQAIEQYEAAQNQRLREIEVEDAKKRVALTERRRRRRWQLSLGIVALMLAVAVIVAEVLRRDQVARSAEQRVLQVQAARRAVDAAGVRLAVANDNPLEESGFDKARIAFEEAGRMVSAIDETELKASVQEGIRQATAGLELVAKNQAFLAQLAEASLPQAPQRSGSKRQPASPTAEEIERRYLEAFARRGIQLDLATDEVDKLEAKIRVLPAPMLPDVGAAVNMFWFELVFAGASTRPDIERTIKLMQLGYRIDQDARSKFLRELVANKLLGIAIPPLEVEQLAASARELDLTSEPSSRILVIWQTLYVLEERRVAVSLLLRAADERPQDLALLATSARQCELSEPPFWEMAIEFRRAMRTLRPETGLGLVFDLLHSQRTQDATVVALDLVAREPNVPEHWVALGTCLSFDPSKRAEEAAAYLQALKVRPDLKQPREQLDELRLSTPEK